MTDKNFILIIDDKKVFIYPGVGVDKKPLARYDRPAQHKVTLAEVVDWLQNIGESQT